MQRICWWECEYCGHRLPSYKGELCPYCPNKQHDSCPHRSYKMVNKAPYMHHLDQHQLDAIEELQNGNILYGNTGSGKSRTALGYYASKIEQECDVFVITTAQKRNLLEWEEEAAKFGISTVPEYSRCGAIHVDSWNNIGKYEDVEGQFFIFDEQRVIGSGAWVKSFLKITAKNKWILLSATPGDTWLDYIPVFIANGFYDNQTQFKREHVIYEPFRRFPVVKAYVNERKLEYLRNKILTEMPFAKHTIPHMNWLDVGYDVEKFGLVHKGRWNIFENRPIKDVAELFYVLRRVLNTDPSRSETLEMLMGMHDKMIVFYNFDYELEILRGFEKYAEIGEYNGHRKTPIPKSKQWLYLVNYRAGAEGWNCIETNAMAHWSMQYSWRTFHQSLGRIDRMNTLWTDLYYYMMSSNSFVDAGILKAHHTKQDFNERKFATEVLDLEDWL